MRKCLLIILLFFLSNFLFAVDFKVKTKTNLYDYFGKIIHEIEKDTSFSIDEISIIFSDDKNNPERLMKYKTVSGLGTYINASDVFIDGHDICPSALINDIWIPEYYYKIIQTNDKTLLEKYENYYADYEQWRFYTDWDNDDWFTEQRTIMLVFGNSYFIIDGFNSFNGALNFVINDVLDNKIYTTCTLSRSNRYDYKLPKTIQDNFSNNKNYIFTYNLDGDYLYLNYDDVKLVFCKSNIDTVQKITDLYYNKIESISDVTWPRHADGSCDFDGSKNNVSSQTSKSTTSTNVSINKTMTVSENLKLRSGEATSTQVLTIMSAGTKVKILELGKAETIDGISSNWVKVEVQANAKDRDGKTIKAGTVGWCYGGYLK